MVFGSKKFLALRIFLLLFILDCTIMRKERMSFVMKKVSIIVPIYNEEENLSKCVNSLVSQTYSNLEIILLNDGSKDKTKEILDSYTDKRIVVIHKENTGIGDTRNKGIKIATGDYLMFVDSDDYIESTCVSKMVEKIESNSFDLVVADYFLDTKNKQQEITFPLEDGSLKEHPEFLFSINLGPCNKIYKADFIKNSSNRFITNLKYEDTPFVTKAICSSKKIGFVHECLFHYVMKATGETLRRDEHIFDILKICAIIEKTLEKYDFIDSTSFIVKILCYYIRTSIYISDKKLRNQFLKEIYNHLKTLDKNWKKCAYLKTLNFKNRFFITHPFVVKLYSIFK